ncbi:hypothetical protein [Alishewanella sp. HL-SH05]|uniref:hypothetical protein n=1 Tax=Alishewanella sp. HL-SH05 TaxID=3461145 RepID=UPI0040426746
MNRSFINLKDALSELRIDEALNKISAKHAPDVTRFLQQTNPRREIIYYIVIQPHELEENKLVTYNKFSNEVANGQKPYFHEITNPQSIEDQYTAGDNFNADFRYHIPEGHKELQITLEDVAKAIIDGETVISTIYLNEFGNVFLELHKPIVRSLSGIKIDFSGLMLWARESYLYLEELTFGDLGSNASLSEVKQRLYIKMKSSDAIHDPILSVYIERMLTLGRLPLMSELDDVFETLFKGKQKRDWPKLTLAPPCDTEDRRPSNPIDKAQAKKRVKGIFLPNALTN